MPIVPPFLGGGFLGGGGASNDLSKLPGAAKIWAWYDPLHGQTLGSYLRNSGGANSITTGGTLTQFLPLQIRIDTTGTGAAASFSVSLDNGGTFIATGQTPATGYVVPSGNGLTLNFNLSATYTAGHLHEAICSTWQARYPPGIPAYTLSVATSATEPLVRKYGPNNLPGGLRFGPNCGFVNELGLCSVFSGTNKSFEVCHFATQLAPPAPTSFNFFWAAQSTGSLTPRFDLQTNGSSATIPNVWVVNRINDAGTGDPHRIAGHYWDLAGRLHDVQVDATAGTIAHTINGAIVDFSEAAVFPWTATMDRFTLGCLHPQLATIQYGNHDCGHFVIYSAPLTPAEQQAQWGGILGVWG